MDYNSKNPVLLARLSRALAGKRLVVFLILTGILLAGLPIFGLFIPKTEAEIISADSAAGITQASLAILEENTLIPLASPGTETETAVRRIRMVVTAYSSTVDQTDSDPHITAAGTVVRDGIVATNVLPFGTKIKMPELYGDKVFIVEDRMNPRKGYQIDIWFPSYWEALNFGAKNTYVEVLEG